MIIVGVMSTMKMLVMKTIVMTISDDSCDAVDDSIGDSDGKH